MLEPEDDLFVVADRVEELLLFEQVIAQPQQMLAEVGGAEARALLDPFVLLQAKTHRPADETLVKDDVASGNESAPRRDGDGVAVVEMDHRREIIMRAAC